MSTSTRLRGNVNPIFTLKKGAAAAISYADDLKKWDWTPAEKDAGDITFYEAGTGDGVDWTLKLTSIVSFDAGSLWMFLFDNVGQDVVVLFGPKGNAAASVTSPHFTGTLTISLPPSMSNEARKTPEGAEFEIELKIVGGFTKVTA